MFNSIIWQNLFPDEEGYCFRLFWIASKIKETYGEEWSEKLVSNPRVVLWDTQRQGRPDMVKLTLTLVDKIKAEVVFITSNAEMTAAFTHGCKMRGVHAFGPIFDS